MPKKPTTPLSLVERQPVLVKGAVIAFATALIHVLVVFGLFDGDTEKALAGLVDAVGTIVALYVASRAVTPNAKVITRVTTDGQVVAGDAARQATGSVVPLLPGDAAAAVAQSEKMRGLLATGPVAVRPDLVA